MIHFSVSNETLPDVGGGMCCYGAAIFGPGRCTCWERIFDQEQEPAKPGLAVKERAQMCADCAFRKDSPERRSEAGYAHAGAVDDLAFEHGFACHQGMRRAVTLRHTTAGVEIDAHPAAYAPLQEKGVTYKADGAPADMCAGWCAANRKALSE